MTILRRFLVPLAAAVIAVGVVSRVSSASSPAATPTTFSLTIAGTDMHTLDPHVQPMFVPGGGVAAVVEPLAIGTYRYLEAGLDLPVGAKVTSVAVTHALCLGAATARNHFVFGSYSPTTRNTAQYVTLAGAPASPCAPATITKTGSPITTTVAGRRYELDFEPLISQPYPANPVEAFYGATIKYSCTSPCVP